MSSIPHPKDILFQPTFGNRPAQIVGRDAEIASFIGGLQNPIGSRERCTLFLGQRGMGKTALLLELEDRASKMGFVTARVTAHEGMPSAIIDQIQLGGSKFFKNEEKSISGVSAGALGFSFGLSFSDAARHQYGFRAKLSLLCDRLAEKDKGVLLLLDEVHTSPAMREVASAYQELVGDQKNIAIGMAGLPHAISGVLNDKVLTFLNRAVKIKLGALSIQEVRAYFDHAFRVLQMNCTDAYLDRAAAATHGLPYLMQLIGYYLSLYAQDSKNIDEPILQNALTAAEKDLEDNVFTPILAPLSDNDRLFLDAMAQKGESITTGQLRELLGEHGPAIQPYRKRLIDAGIIEAPRKGELTFAVPYLAEFLRKERSSAL